MRTALVTAVAALLLVLAPAAEARDDSIKSFDGTKIVLSFFPAKNLPSGGKAPTVLFGPGWSQARTTNGESVSDPTIGSIGVGTLRGAGYNVLTWDPRGFGDSEGTVTVDAAEFEGRDVQALLDYIGRQPEAQLDAPGDPRAGMTGASYGGEIQLVVAGMDRRLDAIVPDIAWNSLGTALLKDDTFKFGWASVLWAAGQQGNLDPHINSAYQSALTTGKISEEDKRWFISRGAGPLLERIRIPTLFTQGTVDTLFTPQEAIDNYAILRRNGVPTKMLWFCGGHGGCLTPTGDGGRIERAALKWLARYLKRDTTVDTGPAFEGIDQDGRAYTGADYPLASAGSLSATGTGTLPLAPGTGTPPALNPGTNAIGAAFAIPSASRGTVAVNVRIPLTKAGLVVGAPKLALTYSGTAGNPDGRVFAQVVDDATGIVLGNLVTPIPVVLDGKPHTVTRPLEPVTATAKPGSSFTLQLIPASAAYDQQRTVGSVSFSAIKVDLPLVDPSKPPPGYGANNPPSGRIPASARLGRLVIGAVPSLSRVRIKNLGVFVSALGGPVRNVRVTLRRRNRVLRRSGLRASLLGRRLFVVSMTKRLVPGSYVVEVTGRRADGRALRSTKRITVRRPAPAGRRP